MGRGTRLSKIPKVEGPGVSGQQMLRGIEAIEADRTTEGLPGWQEDNLPPPLEGLGFGDSRLTSDLTLSWTSL